jgi:RNA polymerase sigma factor (sigma-70 family)
MTERDTEFRRMLEQVQNGSQDDAWKLIELYGPHILRVVRRSLNRQLRSKFDSLDFVQVVWASFFKRRDEILRFEKPDDLIGFLAGMAKNKVLMETRRRLYTEKYNLEKEQMLDGQTTEEEFAEARSLRHETPSQIAVAREQWNRLLESQPPKYQQIVELRFKGATFEEIAESLQIHERTARRIMKDLLKTVDD